MFFSRSQVITTGYWFTPGILWPWHVSHTYVYSSAHHRKVLLCQTANHMFTIEMLAVSCGDISPAILDMFWYGVVVYTIKTSPRLMFYWWMFSLGSVAEAAPSFMAEAERECLGGASWMAQLATEQQKQGENWIIKIVKPTWVIVVVFRISKWVKRMAIGESSYGEGYTFFFQAGWYIFGRENGAQNRLFEFSLDPLQHWLFIRHLFSFWTFHTSQPQIALCEDTADSAATAASAASSATNAATAAGALSAVPWAKISQQKGWQRLRCDITSVWTMNIIWVWILTQFIGWWQTWGLLARPPKGWCTWCSTRLRRGGHITSENGQIGCPWNVLELLFHFVFSFDMFWYVLITYGPHKAVAEVSNHNEPIGRRSGTQLVGKSMDFTFNCFVLNWLTD